MTKLDNITETIITCRPVGGSMWLVTIPGKGNRTIGADRTRDGGVYIWEGHYEASEGERAGVDPGDENSWDVDHDEMADALRAYLGVGEIIVDGMAR